jgi:hypothetical protein
MLAPSCHLIILDSESDHNSPPPITREAKPVKPSGDRIKKSSQKMAEIGDLLLHLLFILTNGLN